MNALTVIKYLFAAVGLALLAGAYGFYNSTASLLAVAETSEAKVIKLVAHRSDDGTTYSPVYVFSTKDGRNIEGESSSSSNPPSYSVGETLKVYYNPANPEDNELDGIFNLWGGAIIMGILGIVFFGIGGGIIASGVVKQRRYAQLKDTGTPVFAEVTGVNYNTSLKVNGRSPYIITAQWQNPSDNKVYIFESDNIWFDPSAHINDEHITVLIDPKNPKNHMIDISFLPELA